MASAAALCLTVAADAAAQSTTRWTAGAYSFSDELGGFRIVGASGAGTKADPIVLKEEFLSATPGTLVIRTIKPIRPFDHSGDYANGFLHLRVEVLNNSRLPWIEFEFELQERVGEPSGFGDGLSFDQRRTDGGNVTSQAFARFSRDFEPADRLRFLDGAIDDLKLGSFSFLISDFTPKWEFYLVQDPRIPSS